jgi:indole-3-glycerol phosphate synthase
MYCYGGTDFYYMNLQEIVMRLLEMDKDDAVLFFRAFFTSKEVDELCMRYAIINELINGTTQREISKKLGVSISQITRGSHELQFGYGKKIFPKIYQKNVLKAILENKKYETDLMPYQSINNIISIRNLPSKPFLSMLRRNNFSIIGEVKKSSPSVGKISRYSTHDIASAYIRANIDAISILTDKAYFNGSISDVTIAHDINKHIPILRKDFIISEKQIVESKANKCSAILLIIKAFKDDYSRFYELYNFAQDIGMEVLVEVENVEEIEIAKKIKPAIIGVNSRNLETLEIDKSKFAILFPKIPNNIYKIALSSIETKDDLLEIKHLCNAALIGTAISSLPINQMGQKIQEFKSVVYEN